MIDPDSNHKRPLEHQSSFLNKKSTTIFLACVHFKSFHILLFLHPKRHRFALLLHSPSRYHPQSIGSRPRDCEFVFRDRRVSKRHCQVLFDASLRKLCILNGVLPHSHGDSTATCRLVLEFRKRAMMSFHGNRDENMWWWRWQLSAAWLEVLSESP